MVGRLKAQEFLKQTEQIQKKKMKNSLVIVFFFPKFLLVEFWSCVQV